MSDRVIWAVFRVTAGGHPPEDCFLKCLSFFNERKGIPDGKGTTQYAESVRHPTNGSIALPINPEDAALIVDAPYTLEITTEAALIAEGFWPNSRLSAMIKLAAKRKRTKTLIYAATGASALLAGAAAAHFAFHLF